MDTSHLDALRVAVFSNEVYTKTEQFQRIKDHKEVMCVMCHGGVVNHAAYFEPNEKSGLSYWDKVRIWYIICTHCLSKCGAGTIQSRIINELLSRNN